MIGAEFDHQSFGGSGITLGVEMGNHDGHACGGKHPAGRSSDGAGAADDERDLPGQGAWIKDADALSDSGGCASTMQGSTSVISFVRRCGNG